MFYCQKIYGIFGFLNMRGHPVSFLSRFLFFLFSFVSRVLEPPQFQDAQNLTILPYDFATMRFVARPSYAGILSHEVCISPQADFYETTKVFGAYTVPRDKAK